MKVIAVFPDTYMGYSHDTLRDIAERKLKKKIGVNECCVFVNKSKTSAKILYQGNALVYYRGRDMFEVQRLLNVPKLIGGSVLSAGREALLELSGLFGANDNYKRKRA